MNTGELIARVRLEIFSDLKDEQIVGRFNELSRRLYRKFTLPDKTYSFTTITNQGYPLPTDCPEDRIRIVKIGTVEYLKVSPELQYPPAFSAKVMEGILYVTPNPSGLEGQIYYNPRPPELSVDDLIAIPALPVDYHTLYVYDAAAWIAGIQRDVDMVNNFKSEYVDLLQDAEKEIRVMGLKKVRLTTEW